MARFETRFDNWEAALSAWLAQCEAQPFKWGSHDCCTFAARAVEVQTGHDFFKPFRGRYRSAAGAFRVLGQAGFASIDAAITAALGDMTAPLLCQRGDVVWDGTRAGIMWMANGPMGLFVGGEQSDGDTHEIGLVRRPLADLVGGWRLRDLGADA